MNHLYLGLISGTSADGIDAALVRFEGDAPDARCELLLGRTYPWADALRTRLIELGQGGDARSLDELGTLDVQVAEGFADAARALLREAGVPAQDVAALGSHGQTVRHRPAGAVPGVPSSGTQAFDSQAFDRHASDKQAPGEQAPDKQAPDKHFPFTWQMGDPHLIAERTGITTIADFRRRDVAAGGQGAPLLPALHAALLRSPREDRAVLNLGGIANLTLLPAEGEVRGFDTGPANALLDAWCRRHTGADFDAGGAFAARGAVDEALLRALLDDPWFAQQPPKSTGREQFHLDWLDRRLLRFRPVDATRHPEDVQATLLELTAATVADALRATQPATRRVLACGGGAHNPVLMARLAARIPGAVVESTAAHGIGPDFVEAMGFAWLARETLAGRPGNLPSVTGARGPRILGAIHPAL